MTATNLASRFQFTRLTDDGKLRTDSLAEAMLDPHVADKTWLFVSPHDDDLCVGAGLFMQAAVRAGVHAQVLIVTDGRMGYCSPEQKDSIVEIRREETYRSFEILGIPKEQLSYIGYPDGGLVQYTGRRKAAEGEPAIAGHVGLQNAFTYYLRKVRPSHVFVPTHTDFHPDHQVTNNELMISLFHAAGAIWPELGEMLSAPPRVGELAVYCPFSAPPNLEIRGDREVFEAKLKGIEAYQSQVQIAEVVDKLRSAGPVEYVREFEYELYSPALYSELFAGD